MSLEQSAFLHFNAHTSRAEPTKSKGMAKKRENTDRKKNDKKSVKTTKRPDETICCASEWNVG